MSCVHLVRERVKGRGRGVPGWDTVFPLSPHCTLHSQILGGSILLLSLGLLGCATPQQRLGQQQQRKDWATVCASAPYGAGASYSPAEQRAMSRLGLWYQSVEEVNQTCQSRR